MDKYQQLQELLKSGAINESDYYSEAADLANRVTDPNDPRQEYARRVYEYMQSMKGAPLESEEEEMMRRALHQKILQESQQRSEPGIYQMLRELLQSKAGR